MRLGRIANCLRKTCWIDHGNLAAMISVRYAGLAHGSKVGRQPGPAQINEAELGKVRAHRGLRRLESVRVPS